MKIHIHNEYRGRFKLEAHKADSEGNPIPGTKRLVADWFDNLITDGGMDAIGATTTYGNACVVGSGNTTPANSQTVLTTFVAGTANITNNSFSTLATTPYYGKKIRTFRFGAGVAAGNLSEIGIVIGSGILSSSPLFSRALIVDGGGSPTTITILSDEILDASYELRIYPYLSDVTTSDTINGVSTAITLRAGSAGDGYWGNILFAGAGLVVGGGALYSGAIGAITTTPSGFLINTAQGLTGGLQGSYVPTSYTRQYYVLSSIGNTWTIGAAVFSTNEGQFQIGFVPTISLLSTQTFRLDITITWARQTI